MVAGGIALGLVKANGISSLIRPANPIFSKKTMRLTRPPKGVMGFSAQARRTYRAGKTGSQIVCIVW